MEGSISSYFTGVGGGLVMSMIAFSIVFIVIVGLMLVMMGMKYVCSVIDSAGKKKDVAPAKPQPTQAAAPAQTPAAAPVQAAAEDDGELLAVISAAIAAACGSAAKVVSFAPAAVRVPAASSWKNIGRLQNLEGF